MVRLFLFVAIKRSGHLRDHPRGTIVHIQYSVLIDMYYVGRYIKAGEQANGLILVIHLQIC